MLVRQSESGTVALHHNPSGANIDLPAEMVLDLFAEKCVRYEQALAEARMRLRLYQRTPVEDDDVREHCVAQALTAAEEALCPS